MDNYKIREVVFGLRDEYRRIEKKLQKLQEYSELDKGFDALSFDVFGYTLGYNYIYKGMFPLSLLRNELIGTFVNRKNGDYCSDGLLKITDEEKFNSLAKETLEDSFLYNIDYTDDKDSDKACIFIDCGSIVIYPNNFSKIYSLHYESIDDSISFYGRSFTKEDIEMVLDCPMPCDIPEYHKEIINKNTNRSKEIDLVLNRKIRKEGYFKIVDGDNRIVLQKSKRLYK